MRLGVANNMHPLIWGGGTNGKDPRYVFRFFYKKNFCFLWANKAPFVFPDFEVDRGIGYIDIGGGTAMQLYFYDPSETAAFNTWDKSHSLDIAPGNRYNLGLSRKRYTDASGFSNCVQEGKEGWVKGKRIFSVCAPPPPPLRYAAPPPPPEHSEHYAPLSTLCSPQYVMLPPVRYAPPVYRARAITW